MVSMETTQLNILILPRVTINKRQTRNNYFVISTVGSILSSVMCYFIYSLIPETSICMLIPVSAKYFLTLGWFSNSFKMNANAPNFILVQNCIQGRVFLLTSRNGAHASNVEFKYTRLFLILLTCRHISRF